MRNFLVANALYWLEEFHVDGLRVDAVASMLYLDYSREAGEWAPNVHGGRENLEAVAFLQEMNATVYKRVPGRRHDRRGVDRLAGRHPADRTSAGSGFGLKWNMGWMHDTLDYLAHEPVHRQYHHNEMTFSLIYACSENFVLPISHDEVVHGKGSLLRKMPGDRWQQLANAARLPRASCGRTPASSCCSWAREFGQESEWAESRSLDWWLLDHADHRGVQQLVARPEPRLPRDTRAVVARPRPGAASSGSTPTTPADNVFSFLRWRRRHGSVAGVRRQLRRRSRTTDYRLGLPVGRARGREVLNTDAEGYGGSGVGNLGGVDADEEPWHGQPASATLAVPRSARSGWCTRADPQPAVSSVEADDGAVAAG